jgi:hypothetical protein
MSDDANVDVTRAKAIFPPPPVPVRSSAGVLVEECPVDRCDELDALWPKNLAVPYKKRFPDCACELPEFWAPALRVDLIRSLLQVYGLPTPSDPIELSELSQRFIRGARDFQNVVERVFWAACVELETPPDFVFQILVRALLLRLRSTIWSVAKLIGVRDRESLKGELLSATLVAGHALRRGGARALWREELKERLSLEDSSSLRTASLLDWDGVEELAKYIGRILGIPDLHARHIKDARFKILLPIIFEDELIVGPVLICRRCEHRTFYLEDPLCPSCRRPALAGDPDYYILRKGRWRPSWAIRCFGPHCDSKNGTPHAGVSRETPCPNGCGCSHYSTRPTNILVRVDGRHVAY